MGHDLLVRFDELTSDEQALVRADEAVWRRAHEIAARDSTLDVSGIYHTLLNFRRTPEERLARSLSIARAYREAASR